jgi:uncharacterized NAD(P)/FAD-binding protein YdhS
MFAPRLPGSPVDTLVALAAEGGVVVADTGDYQAALPHVREHVERFERAARKIGRTHRGRPAPEVRAALMAAFEAEDITVLAESLRVVSDSIALGESRWSG